MAVYSYNGWKAHDIRTVVDMDAYPYVCIIAANDLLVVPDLLYSAHRPVLRPAWGEYVGYVNNMLTWMGNETWYGRSAAGEDGEPKTWSDEYTYCGDDSSQWYASVLCMADYCVWTNFDIYDANGKLVYPKSPDPVLVPEDTRDLRTYCLGIALELMKKALPISKKTAEPIGYLYGNIAKKFETPTHTINGVDYVGAVLPDIQAVYTPELQKEYPYVVLDHIYLSEAAYGAGQRTARMLISNNPFLYRSVSATDNPVGYFALGDVLEFGFVTEGVKPLWGWTFSESYPYPPTDEWVKTSVEWHTDERIYVHHRGSMRLIWTNHEIRKIEDNSVYSAAIDPIPVYE